MVRHFFFFVALALSSLLFYKRKLTARGRKIAYSIIFTCTKPFNEANRNEELLFKDHTDANYLIAYSYSLGGHVRIIPLVALEKGQVILLGDLLDDYWRVK
jgi:uncharacterized protein YtpQ (UPF0354 family)